MWDALGRFADDLRATGEFTGHRASQAVDAMWNELRGALEDRVATDPGVRAQLTELEPQVAAGAIPPSAAARQILRTWLASPGH